MDFVIDAAGDDDLLNKDVLFEETESDFTHIDPDVLSEILANVVTLKNNIIENEKKELAAIQKSRDYKNDVLIENFYTEMGWGSKIGQQTARDKLDKKKDRFHFNDIDYDTGKMKITSSLVDVEKEMKNSVLKPGLEKEVTLPEYDMGEKKLKAIRKLNRDKTKGPSWFNMPAPEMTEKLRNDLKVLKMRSAFDPKRFYKKNDMEALPKYFQVGKVMDSPLDHQNMRLTKKERKQTIVDELLADAEFNRYNRRKYKEIIEEKRQSTYKTYIKDKRKKNKLAHKQRKKESNLQKVNKKRTNH